MTSWANSGLAAAPVRLQTNGMCCCDAAAWCCNLLVVSTAHLVQQQVRHVALSARHFGPVPVRHRLDAAHTEQGWECWGDALGYSMTWRDALGPSRSATVSMLRKREGFSGQERFALKLARWLQAHTP